MKRTDLKKHAAALLLVLCLLVTSALPALATSANIKLVDSSGSTVTSSQLCASPFGMHNS